MDHKYQVSWYHDGIIFRLSFARTNQLTVYRRTIPTDSFCETYIAQDKIVLFCCFILYLNCRSLFQTFLMPEISSASTSTTVKLYSSFIFTISLFRK